MAINIKNQDVESLLNEVVNLTGETKTEAIRKALEERRRRLSLHFASPNKHQRLVALLEEEIWPQIPADQLGKRLSKEDEEAILGYGELGI
ncbi:type II toxin-antitoxin system VapB family antitoxin [Candidatus Leptofilum sp.]|uniref:type II toxin-antitoxin system VapB family antitoxin n=1 Tax=Candidatus Leptofilum sp. TaxID=3241576 RepID=UPI003B5A7D14